MRVGSSKTLISSYFLRCPLFRRSCLERSESTCTPWKTNAVTYTQQALRQAEANPQDAANRRVLLSTRAILFFGTPHRGSPRNAVVGDTIYSFASKLLRVDSNPALLRSLLNDCAEVELGRKEFLRIRKLYLFRVKTFQEACGITGVNLLGMNSKVRILKFHDVRKFPYSINTVYRLSQMCLQYLTIPPATNESKRSTRTIWICADLAMSKIRNI